MKSLLITLAIVLAIVLRCIIPAIDSYEPIKAKGETRADVMEDLLEILETNPRE